MPKSVFIFEIALRVCGGGVLPLMPSFVVANRCAHLSLMPGDDNLPFRGMAALVIKADARSDPFACQKV